jgi:hypothetical protein
LNNASVQYERHRDHFQLGELDTVWLPPVCEKRWIVLTKDKGIRYNQLEIRAIVDNKGREFFFRSGNWNGAKLAEILAKALPKMKRMAAKVDPPFIASLTEAGDVNLKYDRNGPVHRQQTRKHKGPNEISQSETN